VPPPPLLLLLLLLLHAWPCTTVDVFDTQPIGSVEGTATCLVFLPGSPARGLVCRKTGAIDIFVVPERGTMIKDMETYLRVPSVAVNSRFERGLLDAVPHPDFPANPAIYLYMSGPSRFNILTVRHDELQGGTASRAIWTSRALVWSDPDGLPGRYHYGGQLSFGPGNMLFLTTGDKAGP